MTLRIESEAFVLHARPYRETSALITLWSPNEGRQSLIARGVKRPKSILKGLLQPFQRLWIEWQPSASGGGTLYQANLLKRESLDSHSSCVAGLYLNELLYKLLPEQDAHPQLFEAYGKALPRLATTDMELTLRYFESSLLQELGYGFDYRKDASGVPITAEAAYHYIPEHGFVRQPLNPPHALKGSSILALASERLLPEHMIDAKRLLRVALGSHLQHNPLHSRLFFVAGA